MGIYLRNKCFNLVLFLVYTRIRFFISFSFLVLFAMEAHSNDIYVGGEMLESQTWTKENTYIVDQDLIIPSGIILTIESGVQVRIDYNRTIIVDNGSLRVMGIENDTVSFSPNYVEDDEHWNWKGLVIKNIDGGSYINYAKLFGAEAAIELEDCKGVSIENSYILNCQNYGVKIINSDFCTINNCEKINNFNGVEMITGEMGSVSNTTISNCIIKNQNLNIEIDGKTNSTTRDNVIVGNLIGNGNNGVWIRNRGNNSNSGNIISQNIILNIDVGFGLYLDHDSITVSNNIFWRNIKAIQNTPYSNGCSIKNNSFYQNEEVIILGLGAIGNNFSNNTFSLNESEVFIIRETEGVIFSNNNIIHNEDKQNIIFHSSREDLSITNNYWGTNDTTIINNLIYDIYDGSSLGELIYNPFLTKEDTTSPISPPYKVKKQINGNNLIVSWNSNNEEDLMGYKVYYGDYSDYGFSQNHQLGLDTSFVINGYNSIFDSVAVTAYDNTFSSSNLQLTGHESPFEFGEFYPFSGNDTTICSDLTEYKILNSNIPFVYEDLLWSTNGDGFFSDPLSLNPSYFPGFVDKLNGGTKIFLEVNTLSKSYTDSFDLTILKTPIAFAGNDTIVFPDIPLSLVNAAAYNYDSVKWFTSGDGVFDFDNIINPIYSPGLLDIESGVVFLEINAYSYCEASVDTVKVIVESYYSAQGQLWGNDKYTGKSVVIAYMENEEGPRAVQIESPQIDGSFKFEKLISGNYYFYAVPDTNNIVTFIPGYYANKKDWQSAHLLSVDADVYDVDISFPTVDYLLPEGEASISGHMILPSESKYNSDIYCRYWLRFTSNTFCIDGLSNSTVLLYNNDKTKLLDYTLTDNLGNFYFNDLPYGTYVVDVEKAGFTSVSSDGITLTPQYKDESGLILEISQQKIAISIESRLSEDNTLIVFPNPSTNEININHINPLLLETKVEIFDLFGNSVITLVIPQEFISPSNFKIDIKELTSGLYFGRLIRPDKTLQFRFVKK